MEVKEKVLEAMKAAGRPVSAGEVAEMTGIDRKLVDKAFAELKKEEKSNHRLGANGNQNNKGLETQSPFLFTLLSETEKEPRKGSFSIPGR